MFNKKKKKELKVKDITNLTTNKTTKQKSLNIQARKFKKFGLVIDDLLNLDIKKIKKKGIKKW